MSNSDASISHKLQRKAAEIVVESILKKWTKKTENRNF